MGKTFAINAAANTERQCTRPVGVEFLLRKLMNHVEE